MKKTKILAIIVVIITLFLALACIVWAENDKDTYNGLDNYNDKNGVGINLNTLRKNNNVYCIQHSQHLAWDFTPTYRIHSKVDIIGETAIVSVRSGNGNSYKLEEKYTFEDESNNILGAILTKGGGYGDNRDNPPYTETQAAVWYYMPEWVAVLKNKCNNDTVGFPEEGLSKETDTDLINRGAAALEEAKVNAKNNYYKATMYLLITEELYDKEMRYWQDLIVTYPDPDGPITKETKIPVLKIWKDNENMYNTRPGEIEVKLLANGLDTGKTLTLKASDNEEENWKGIFRDLDAEDENGNEIVYTVEEITKPGYEPKILPVEIDGAWGFEITNILQTNINVKKEWNDEDNLDDLRPTSITVTLCTIVNTNGSTNVNPTEKKVVLSQTNGWTGSFTNLDVFDANGEVIEYTVQEEVSNGYTPEYERSVDEKGNVTYIITNTHKPEYEGYIEINGKVWKDRPDGKGNDINGIKEDDESGIEGIKVILKDKDGKMFDATSFDYTDSNGEYTIKVNYDNNQNVYKLYEDVATVNEKLKTAYVEFEYDAMKYTTVDTLTQEQINQYNLNVVKHNSKLKRAYASFENFAMDYTTADSLGTLTQEEINKYNSYVLSFNENENPDKEARKLITKADVSKSIENEAKRIRFDKVHPRVNPNTEHPDNWKDNAITANTKDVISFETYTDKVTISREEILKYCNGDGTYKRTNSTHAWYDIQTGTHDCANCQGEGHTLNVYDIDVEVINNVNLGLFEREQPKVHLSTDISKVDVIVRNQQYTYLYNERTEVAEAKAKEAYNSAYQYALDNGMSEEAARAYATQERIKVKFQHKDIYTYRMPINPADIAYLNDGGEAMTVLVTYEVTVGNISSTLPITVQNIATYFDSRYTLLTEGWKTTTGEDFNQAIYNGDLKIEIQPQQSKVIELKYSVSLEAIKGLLNEEATLNQAAEILVYSTQYGEKTLYAEQRTGGRTNHPYAGYDYESQPGNAGYFINQEGRLQAAKPESDNDEAPSFILCKNEQKVLSGTVWEDTDSNNGDDFRLGNGKNDNENGVANVKVELLKVNADGTMETAYLYHRDDDEETRELRKKTAVSYTDSQGNYAFGSNNPESPDYGYGVVTDTYVIKFTYGEEGPIKDARNYKSTIISPDTDLYNIFKETMSSDEWHLNLSDGYSIAVDDMQQRMLIEDLQYSNFNEQYNMTAYSRPFELQLEFDPSTGKTSAVSSDGKVAFGNELNIFDFGIIERAREDIFVENTIENVKITVADHSIFINGSPKEELNNTIAIGFNQDISTGVQAKNALDKQIKVAMDTELIQSAQLEIKYAIKVTNKSEKDYEYYVDGQLRTEYYYFGTNNEGSPEVIHSVDNLINYLDKDPEYTWDNASNWQQVTADDLRNQGYISEATYNELSNEKYLMYITHQFGELRPGETKTDYVTGRKSLANGNENVYDSHLEILRINKSTARTIKEARIDKEYKMGNYVPSLEQRIINTDINQELSGYHEQDDDRVSISITPPTGDTNYITLYIIAGMFGLLVIGVGIIFIKKKVLTK